jgi:hypothetical protein
VPRKSQPSKKQGVLKIGTDASKKGEIFMLGKETPVGEIYNACVRLLGPDGTMNLDLQLIERVTAAMIAAARPSAIKSKQMTAVLALAAASRATIEILAIAQHTERKVEPLLERWDKTHGESYRKKITKKIQAHKDKLLKGIDPKGSQPRKQSAKKHAQ